MRILPGASRRIFHFSPSRAVPRALNDVNKPKRLGTRLQTFLKLIDKHFPPSNKLHKLFNRHTVRVSYSCMTNMKNLIRKHNRKILNRNTKRTPTARVIQSSIPTVIPTPTKNDTPMCNCQKPANCPLGKKCLTESIVYKAEVTTSTANNQEKKIYIGMTADDFKTRYRNHTKSFRHEEYKNNTELSKYCLETEVRKKSVYNKVVHYEESQSMQTRI